MKIRSLFLTVLVVFAMLIAAVSAQDIDPCFGLSAEDCAYIAEVSANGLGDAESFTVDVSIAFSAEGVPAGEDSIDAVFNMEGSIDVAVGQGALLPFNFAGTFDVTAESAGDETVSTFDMLAVDDILYIGVDGEFLFIDMVEFMSDEDVAAVFGDFTDSMGELDGVMGEMSDEDLAPLVSLITLPGLLNYERDGDDFVFTVDLTALQALLEPDNEDLLNTIIDGASAADPTLAFMIPAIPALIEEGTIQVVQTVNSDLEIVQEIQFNVDFSAQLGALTTGDATAPATEVSLAVTVSFGNFDGVDAIEAPEDATDFTEQAIESFVQGAGGF